MPGVCPRCLREVYFAEEKLALGKVWHTFCFSCRNCRKLLDSCTVATHCGELFCRNCCTRLFAPSVQPPPQPPTLDLPVEDRGPPFPSGRGSASAYESLTDCHCCCCCLQPEECSVAGVNSEDFRDSRVEKQRLRGGGGEEEDAEDFRLAGGTRRCSHSDCSNLGVLSSVTTLCNAPSSPTAVTTWYNRQHSSSQSTFGGPTSTKKRLSCSISNPRPRTPVTNFRGNDGDCLKHNSDRGNGVGNKCSTGRRPSTPCRSVHQQRKLQHQQSQQAQSQQNQILESSRQALREEEIQEQQHRQQQIPQEHERHQLQQKPIHQRQQQMQQSQLVQEHHQQHQQQLQQKIQSINFDRNKKGNSHRSPLTHLRASEVTETANSPPYDSSYPTIMQNDTNTPDNNYPCSSNATSYETCYETENPTSCTYEETLQPPYNCSTENPEDPFPPNSNPEGESRLRGGCGGGSRNGGCGCGGGSGGCGVSFSVGSSGLGQCPPRDECRDLGPPCGTPSCDPPCGSRTGGCPPPGCRPVCRKPGRSYCPPCTSEPPGCGGGGCCGSGCRGGCGKPRQVCMPRRPCSTPPCLPRPCRPRGSPCMSTKRCAPPPPCCKSSGVPARTSCPIGGGRTSCCRSKSPARRGCCPTPQDDAGCGYCGPKLHTGCECLGGGLDCQRCGRKVYQAEMQIVSGVPYHNICFSCFCCRKPLEPLTYQENCGEIYCKQCYVRNFGPQGYGYGAGAGVLQTPL